mmetsp:Transcript_12604/g.34738  ORF Transcript_12604/g.34738 Transcript_12604/m.34738 type:complete len:257 (-) Transcript_12604:1264-2034(-)
MVAAGDGAARRWILREDLVRSTLAAFFDVGDHGTDGARPDNRLWEMSVDEAMDIITKGAEPADRARLGNDLAATLEAGLLAAGCLRVYLLERELPEMGLSDGVLSNEVKTYWGPFQRLDAGWGLAGVVWHGVEALERSRRYKESADVLRAILATPFQMHRRGVMFDRLALDLQHLGQRADALEACLAGLADKCVGLVHWDVGGTISSQHYPFKSKWEVPSAASALSRVVKMLWRNCDWRVTGALPAAIGLRFSGGR